MANCKIEATCPCGWTGPLDDLDLAYYELVCPECGADDWRVSLASGEIAMQVMSEAFRAVVEMWGNSTIESLDNGGEINYNNSCG